RRPRWRRTEVVMRIVPSTLDRPASRTGEPGQEPLQPCLIVRVARVCSLGVDVEHGDQLACSTEHRDDDLRSRTGVARDVSRKLVHIRDAHRAPRGHIPGARPRGCRTADAPAERDLEAAKRALIGPDAQQLWRYDAIEPRP